MVFCETCQFLFFAFWEIKFLKLLRSSKTICKGQEGWSFLYFMTFKKLRIKPTFLTILSFIYLTKLFVYSFIQKTRDSMHCECTCIFRSPQCAQSHPNQVLWRAHFNCKLRAQSLTLVCLFQLSCRMHQNHLADFPGNLPTGRSTLVTCEIRLVVLVCPTW